MNPDYGAVYLNSVMLICAIMTVLNLARYKKRGLSAIFLGVAFLMLGLTVYAYILKFSPVLIGIGAVMVFLLLAADMAYRVGRPPQGPSGSGPLGGGKK